MSEDAPHGSRGPLSIAWLAVLSAGLLASVALVAVIGFRFARVGLADLRAAIAAKPSAAPTRLPMPTVTASPEQQRVLAPTARMPAPRYGPSDAARNAPDAYADLMHASQRGDAATVAKYLLQAELGRKQPVEQALRELMPPVPIEALVLARSKPSGDRAVLLFNAQAPRVQDVKGKPAPIQVVVRMLREDGYWKLFRQTWLINSPPGQHESEALAWAAAGPATAGTPSDAVKKLQALGVAYDATHFQSAVVRGQLDQVRLFLKAGMSPSTQMQNGDSSLFYLALLGLTGEPAHEEIVLAMIEAGRAPIDERTPTGMTPMTRAASVCKPRVVEALLRAGANPSSVDNFKRTPRQWAKPGCPAAERLLAAVGAR